MISKDTTAINKDGLPTLEKFEDEDTKGR